MRKAARWGLVVVVCMALGAIGVLAFQHAQTTSANNTSTSVDLTVLDEAMQNNRELSTAKYLYTDSVSITDQNDLGIIGRSDIKLPLTDATYVLQFDGTVKAGFDLSGVTPTLDGDTVVVRLSQPEVLSHETGNVQVVYQQQNILNPLKAGEESSWVDERKLDMEQRAIDQGLFDDAKQNAKATFESLFADSLPAGTTLDVEFEDEGGDAE